MPLITSAFPHKWPPTLYIHSPTLYHPHLQTLDCPGEKDRANTWLARALVGTMRISAEIRKILTVQRLVTPQRAGASGSKINDDSVSTFKQACSGRYSGSLKLSSRRFERAHNRSAPLLTLFSISPEVNGLGRYRAVIRVKFGVKTAYFQQQTTRARVPFLPGVHTVTIHGHSHRLLNPTYTYHQWTYT